MATKYTTDVDIQVASDADDLPDEDTMADWIRAGIDGANPDSGTGIEVALRIVDADEMQTLNRDYRGKDRVTNVLSFPAYSAGLLPEDAPRVLGDIVVCAPVVTREAGEQGKRVEDHWAHLLVHGTLHLLGFDHEEEAEAEEMEAAEVRILSQHGIADPYTLS